MLPTRAELDDWNLCWRVNAVIQGKVIEYQAGKCMSCRAQVDKAVSSKFSKLLSCSAGHVPGQQQIWRAPRTVLICTKCDIDFVWRAALRQQECFHEGCRRTLKVNAARLRQTLKFDSLYE